MYKQMKYSVEHTGPSFHFFQQSFVWTYLHVTFKSHSNLQYYSYMIEILCQTVGGQ